MTEAVRPVATHIRRLIVARLEDTYVGQPEPDLSPRLGSGLRTSRSASSGRQPRRCENQLYSLPICSLLLRATETAATQIRRIRGGFLPEAHPSRARIASSVPVTIPLTLTSRPLYFNGSARTSQTERVFVTGTGDAARFCAATGASNRAEMIVI